MKRENCEYLAIDSELGHGIHNAQEGGDRLCLLTDLGLVYFELEPVVFKVLLDLLSVYIVYIQVCDSQHSAPMFVALSQLWVPWVEDAVQESEVVGDLLVPVDMEAVLGLQNRCSEVRHVEGVRILICGVVLNLQCSLGYWSFQRRKWDGDEYIKPRP